MWFNDVETKPESSLVLLASCVALFYRSGGNEKASGKQGFAAETAKIRQRFAAAGEGSAGRARAALVSGEVGRLEDPAPRPGDAHGVQGRGRDAVVGRDLHASRPSMARASRRRRPSRCSVSSTLNLRRRKPSFFWQAMKRVLVTTACSAGWSSSQSRPAWPRENSLRDPADEVDADCACVLCPCCCRCRRSRPRARRRPSRRRRAPRPAAAHAPTSR